MKTIAKVAYLLIAAGSSFVWGQTVWNTSKIGAYNGYDYELWNQNNKGTVSMTLTGDNGQGASAKGGTFTAQWSGTENVLFRSGKKWGSSSNQNHTQIGNMTIDFAATWSSSDNVKYLGVYGWAYFTQANTPSNFSNQIEYYIIQDRGSYNPCNNQQGTTAVIDGIEYGFHVCDRINQPMLTGNGNFKQFFSIPKDTRNHRTSGKISVSEHFNAWQARGMNMNGPLYEVAMKVESYTGSPNGTGNATVTKNILTIGGSASAPSSNSTGGGNSSSSSRPAVSSSSSRPAQATTCPAASYIGALPANPNPPANPYTACFKHSNNKCYVCKVDNEGDGNTCSSTWVWNGNHVESNLADGYWYREVACPAGAVPSSSSAASSSVASSSSRASSSSVAASSSSSLQSSSTGGSSSSSGDAAVSSSSQPGSSSSLLQSASSSSAGGGSQACGEYQESFCGGMAFGDVADLSAAVPTLGQCLFIGDFEAIQPGLNSTLALNGLENACGASWDDCPYNTRPPAKDGGYYVYVKSGTVNTYQNNGWQGIEAKAKSAECPSSSSGGGNGGGVSSGSGGGDISPIKVLSSVPSAKFQVRSMGNGALLVESHARSAIYLYSAKGSLAKKFDIPAGSSIVSLSVPAGLYVAKNAASRQTQIVVVK